MSNPQINGYVNIYIELLKSATELAKEMGMPPQSCAAASITFTGGLLSALVRDVGMRFDDPHEEQLVIIGKELLTDLKVLIPKAFE